MATLRQRDSGYWQAIVRRRGYPDQSKTFRTKLDAEAWARSIESNIDKGTFVSANAAERTLFSEIAVAFRSSYAPNHYKTRLDKKEAWRYQVARLEEYFGQYSLAAIDQQLVAKFRDQRLAGSKMRPAVGETTVRKDLFMLSKTLTFAEIELGIPLPRGNPVDKIRKPREGKGRDRRLNANEWATLERELKKSRNLYLWPAVMLATETAMRQEELLTLRWDRIDMERRIALLPDTKNGEPRSVPLSSRAMAAINSLSNTTAPRVIPLERLTLYHAFVAACKRARIENFTFHDLRHEALSRLAERGDFSILELAEVSGHKTLQMLKRYTHLNAARLAKKLG